MLYILDSSFQKVSLTRSSFPSYQKLHMLGFNCLAPETFLPPGSSSDEGFVDDPAVSFCSTSCMNYIYIQKI